MTLSIGIVEVMLLIAGIVAMVARRMRLPYTVGLVAAGIAIALSPLHLHVVLTRELIFGAFLPPLIFEAALQIHWSDLRRDLRVIGVFASLGVVLSASVVGAGVHYLLGWPWSASLLLAVLLSATDPVSVIATFRELHVKGRLRLLVEAESLLNDGTVAVLFTVMVGVIAGVALHPAEAVSRFLLSVLGGASVGALVGVGLLLLAWPTQDHLVEITFTTVAAYGSFAAAERLGLSGVIATMAAGILIGNTKAGGMLSPRGREAVVSFWDYVAFVVNSLVFLLIGMNLAREDFTSAWLPIFTVVLLTLVGRAVTVYGCSALFARTAGRIPGGMQHILFWGGLRGALALALALSLPDGMVHRRLIVVLAFAVVAFSVIVQGLSLLPLLRILGLMPGHLLGQEQALPVTAPPSRDD